MMTGMIFGFLWTSTASKTRSGAGEIIAGCTILWLLITQVLAIHGLDNRLSPHGSPTADPFSEANAIRAAQHYADYGFTVDAGLPHIVYGDRFPGAGWVTDPLDPLPSGVYTRYPPLPDLICGVLEKIIGFEHLWAWRIVPVFFGLMATAYAFLGLRQVLGPVPSGVMTILLSLVPMATSHMHGLHFEGYAQAAFLSELVLITRIFFSNDPPSKASQLGVFALGFLQGWLSFEYAFVVAGAAVPLALIAGANDHRIGASLTMRVVVLSVAGFTTAHLLHFLQVVDFYGSVSMALQDYSGRALYRIHGDNRSPEANYPYWTQVVSNFHVYAELLWFSFDHFGPLLPLMSIAGGLQRNPRERISVSDGLIKRSFSLISDRKALVAVVTSYAISAVWLVIMPSHARMHLHITPRIFFLSYFTAVLCVCSMLARNWKMRPLSFN